jgi:hypothetical protein
MPPGMRAALSPERSRYARYLQPGYDAVSDIASTQPGGIGMRILDLYCSVDAFWQRFEPLWERDLLTSGQRRRRRATRLHPSEILTILILFQQSG